MASQSRLPATSVARAPFRPALDSLPPEIVDRMRSRLPCQHKETVMDVLGISSNTWLKLRREQQIRSSIADRLKRHFGEDRTV